MKNYQNILAIVALLTISSVCFAEDNVTVVKQQYQPGDKVHIRRDNTVYLTGEKPSEWVYDREHTVWQVGTKRFPEGILLKEIISWIDPYYLGEKADTIVTTTEPQQEVQPSAKTTKQPQQPQPTQEEEVTKPIKQVTENVKTQEEPAKQVEEQKAEEQKTEDENTPVVTTYYKEEETQKEAPMATRGARTDRMHRFSIGVRGGAASLMHDADKMGKWKLGFDALLDLQYAYYFGAKFGKKVNPGILTGVSVGWGQSNLKSDVTDNPIVSTEDGDIQYNYNVEGVNEKDGQLQIEVPLMFTMLTEKGFFLNVGPRFVVPVYSHYRQTIDGGQVDATFVKEGVTVHDALITGKLEDDQKDTKGKWDASKIDIFVSAELGYEWMLKSGNSLGLGAYANYSVYSLYKNDTENKSLLTPTTLPSSAGPAKLEVLSATDTYNKGIGYFDAGVKLVYHFNFPVKK